MTAAVICHLSAARVRGQVRSGQLLLRGGCKLCANYKLGNMRQRGCQHSIRKEASVLPAKIDSLHLLYEPVTTQRQEEAYGPVPHADVMRSETTRIGPGGRNSKCLTLPMHQKFKPNLMSGRGELHRGVKRLLSGLKVSL